MSDKHKPLPKLTVDDENHPCWFSHKNNVDEDYHYITGDDENTTIDIVAIISKEHADQIVKACNNHDALMNRLKNLVNADNCPDCPNVGFYIVPDHDGCGEQVQCQVCYTHENSVFNRIAEAKQLLEQIDD